MGIMSDVEITHSLESKELIIHEFDKEFLNPASYDARAGKQIFKTRPGRGLTDISEKGVAIIEIGEFAIISTHESFELPKNIAGKIGLRSHYARKGIIILSGPQVDPGFKGILTVGIYNVGPKDVAIPYLEPFCTIEFYKLTVPATKGYTGEYQNQIKIPSKDIEYFVEGKGATLAEVIQSVSGLSNSVNRLENTVNALKLSLWAIPVITTVVVTIVVAVLLWVFPRA
ncbi:MAG TPA: dCTP deaminase [Methanomicrobiales archaeon]|nr:dCTP deaminase [Methanomicrobiales archaeon]